LGGRHIRTTAQEFAERLKAERTALLFCELVKIEFWHGWKKAAETQAFPYEWANWDNLAGRVPYLKRGDRLLKQFLSQFPAYEQKILKTIKDNVVDIMAMYNLGSYDAIHIGTAIYRKVYNIASFDEDFRRVGGIQLWNNRAFG